MGKMGIGYGSEFQLMRFMARHREELEREIREQAKVEGDFKWLDFEYSDDKDSVSGDDELQGLSWIVELFEDEFSRKVRKAVDKFDSGRKSVWSNWQSWDSVCRVGDTLCLIEAKAHVDEFASKCNAKSDKSRKSICSLLDVDEKTLTDLNCYQMANRLAVAKLISDEGGIKVNVVYICFENDGFGNGKRTSRKEFEAKIDEERKG